MTRPLQIGLSIVFMTVTGYWSSVAMAAHATAAHGTRIVINVVQHRLYLYRHNKLFQSYPVAVGKSQTPTPRGEFVITQKAVWGDGFGTRWMRFSAPWGIYGIHGTNKPWSVGTVASHGCVRMLNHDVEQLYALVSVGTPVIIQGKTPYAAVKRTLKPGSLGQDVIEAQRLLKLARCYSGPLNGLYNGSVKEAAKKFQAMVGLPTTGDIDQKTLNALQNYTKEVGKSPGYLNSYGR